MRAGVGVLICLIALYATGRTDPKLLYEPTTRDYPSEEELFFALQTGQLDLPEYLERRERLRFAFDHAPISYRHTVPRDTHFLSSLEQAQREGDTVNPNLAGQYRTHHTTAWGTRFQSGREDIRYRWELTGPLRSDIEYTLSLLRSYRETGRIGARSIRLLSQPDRTFALTFGNYGYKHRLGLVLGNRERLLAGDDLDADASILFPSSTRHNGFLVRAVLLDTRFDLLYSHHRDNAHDHLMVAGVTEFSETAFAPSVHISVSTIRRRATERKVGIATIGVAAKHSLGNLFAEFEGAIQVEETPRPGGIMLGLSGESSMIWWEGELWAYHDQFRDFSSGGSSVRMYRQAALTDVDFEYRTRRAGQEGGRIHLRMTVDDNYALINQIRYGQIDRDSSRFDLRTTLTRTFPGGSVGELTALIDASRPATGERSENPDAEMRVEARLALGRLTLREYIGVDFSSGEVRIVGLVHPVVQFRPGGFFVEAYCSFRGSAEADERETPVHLFARLGGEVLRDWRVSFKGGKRFDAAVQDTEQFFLAIESEAKL